MIRSGVSVKDSTIYVLGLPLCPDCTKAIIQSGIKRVVVSPDPYTPQYPNGLSSGMRSQDQCYQR